jgi:thiosulfate dehydrogenase [quinone] large subunit
MPAKKPMSIDTPTGIARSTATNIACVRISFGIIWAIDAVFKYEPAFYRSLLTAVKSADAGEPGWLNSWFHSWYRIIGLDQRAFAIVIIIIETLVALALLLGVARRLSYALGAIFSFLIWSVGEGFGGPYVAGSTDVGAGIIYVVVFLLLYVADGGTLPLRWSLDSWLMKRISWWHVLANR